MRPFGLEGKVGAPAIVKTNPLRAPFATYLDRDERYFQPTLPLQLLAPVSFTWPDVLELIQDRYPASMDDERLRGSLQSFASCATRFLPDRLLRYDLDTPELRMSFGVSPYSGWDDRYTRTPKVVVLTGALRYFHLSDSITCGVADGPIDSGHAEHALLVVRSSASSLHSSGGVLVHAARERPPDGLGSDNGGIIISEAILPDSPYNNHDEGVGCGPGFHPVARAIYDRALALADRPLDLSAASAQICSDASRLFQGMVYGSTAVDSLTTPRPDR